MSCTLYQITLAQLSIRSISLNSRVIHTSKLKNLTSVHSIILSNITAMRTIVIHQVNSYWNYHLALKTGNKSSLEYTREHVWTFKVSRLGIIQLTIHTQFQEYISRQDWHTQLQSMQIQMPFIVALKRNISHGTCLSIMPILLNHLCKAN